jgi:hypothetical protein
VNALVVLYQTSRLKRCYELLTQPWLAIAGLGMTVYLAIKALPLYPELIALLDRGLQGWLALSPGFILVPFYLFYGSVCTRAVAACWLDALGSSTLVKEGVVNHVSSTPFTFTSGRSVISGTANHLSVEGKLFTNLPARVLKQLRVGDLVRVRHTPRVQYVVALVRLSR